MEWFLALLAVLVIGVAAVAGSGRLGQFPADTARRPGLILPTEPLTAADIEAVRFAVTPRGYAMDQVDALLDRLVSQLSVSPPDAESVEPGIMGSAHDLVQKE